MTPMPAASFSARWFDGRTAAGAAATLTVADGMLHASAGEAARLEIPLREVSTSAPVAGVPLRITVPGGGVFVLDDAAADPRAFGARVPQGFVHRLERNPAVVVIALLGVAAIAVLAYRNVIPWLAGAIAQRIPIAAEARLGDAALASLDRLIFAPSKLPAAQRADLEDRFRRLARVAELPAEPKLVFRNGRRIGANALALPGGTVLVTDQLVARMASPDEVTAALAHELGHIAHRHTMRQMLEQSASGLILGAVLGDVSGIGSLAAAAPAMLIGLSYSRASEEEADDYALKLLPRAGLSPALLADSLEAIAAPDCSPAEAADAAAAADKESGEDYCPRKRRGRIAPPAYLSTHPDLEERIARARAALP